MTSFTDLGLAKPILRALANEGHDHPTPIQDAAILPLIEQHDLIGIAQTGTGKTAAFLLPILHHLASHGDRRRGSTSRSLVLAPTRELAGQIEASLKRYSRFMRVSSALVIGGASARHQLRALSRRPDFIVATPGRLLDHMANANLDLGEIDTVVLDEADQMLDMGFLPAMRRILAALPRTRQTVLFSATMPREIRALAADFMRDPVEVSVAPAATPVELVKQQALAVPASEKRQKLKEILSQNGVTRAIVFTRTKHGADRVTRFLEQGGLSAAAIHGNKSQNQRERTLADFKAGRVRTLVATDIAARGIDIDAVSHVVNFELPNVPEAYVHRIGRTARAGASGHAISLVDVNERGLLRTIEKLIGTQLLPEDETEKRAQPRRRSKPGKRPEEASSAPRQAKRRPRRRRNGNAGRPSQSQARAA